LVWSTDRQVRSGKPVATVQLPVNETVVLESVAYRVKVNTARMVSRIYSGNG